MALDALGALQAAKAGQNNPNINTSSRQKLEEVATEFESLFVKQVLDSMRKNQQKENLLVEGGMAEDIFEDMLYTEYAKVMAKTGDFGIAKAIVRQYEGVLPGADASKAYK